MTKENLLALIDQAIVIGESKHKQDKRPTPIYITATTLLKRLKQKIINDVPPEKPYNSADSLGVYAVKEVELFDEDYASILCDISNGYNEYYHLPLY